MNTVAILIKTDPQIKAEAKKTAAKLGLSLTSIINSYLKHFISTKTITFSAKDEIPSEYFKKLMKQADEDLKAGRASPSFKTGEEAAAWLEKQGI